jgi:putative heme-binding domain-containing protein
VAADSEEDSERRADALRLLAMADPEPFRALLEDLVKPGAPEAIQAAAVEALGRIQDDSIGGWVLAKWRELPPAARAEGGDILVRDDKNVVALIEDLEQGTIQPWMLTARHRHRLIMLPDPKLRVRARASLTSGELDRQAVVERYQAALEKEGDAGRGRAVFEQACAKCHALDGKGKEVGPDLATVRSRPAALILEDILMPNRSITQTYEAYVVETRDGRNIDGVIGPQGPAFITLRRENGEEDLIQRQDIQSMYATNLSAMPGDLENQVSVDEMADLLRYIKSAP